VTKFNVGDKIVVQPHQWNIERRNVTEAITGTVVAVWDDSHVGTEYQVEHQAPSGRTSQIWTARSEADNLVAPGPQIKVGDKVVYTGHETARFHGKTGTVRYIERGYRGLRGDRPWASLDGDFLGAYLDNLSLVVEEPETTAAPLAGSTPELRERILTEVMRNSTSDTDYEAILTMARAFEAYILGGTK
jgi:hypothetical protein